MWASSISERSLKKHKNQDLRTLMSTAKFDRFKKPELPKLSRPGTATGYKRKHSAISGGSPLPKITSGLGPIYRPSPRPTSSSSWIESCSVTRPRPLPPPPSPHNSSNSWLFPSMDLSQSEFELPPRPQSAMSTSQRANPCHDSGAFISQMLGLPSTSTSTPPRPPPSPARSMATTTTVPSIARHYSSAYLARGLQPALPQGIETNPRVTKRYSVKELMDILCGFTPIPEEDMFTGGPLKARYYDEQCLKNTKENSLYQYVPEVQKGSSKRCQLFEDFEESSSFSIDMMPQGNICSASPLQDISNLGRRPSTARARGQVRFFLDTEDQDQEQQVQSSEDTFFQDPLLTPVKKTYFNDLDLDSFPSAPVSSQVDLFSQSYDYDPLF